MLPQTPGVGTFTRVELAKCSVCPLAPYNQWAVPGWGTLNAEIVLVGEMPGQNEVNERRPFVGMSGDLLNNTLKLVGLTRDQVYIANAVMCRPHANVTPTATSIDACSGRLHAELDACVNKKVIVCMGTSAIRGVTGKSDSLMKALYKIEWSERFRCWVTYCYHPAACFRNPALFNDVYDSFVRVAEVVRGEFQLDHTPTVYRVVESEAECIEALRTVQALPAETIIGSDIESDSLDWTVTPILEIGFSWEHGRAVVIPWERGAEEPVPVKWRLADGSHAWYELQRTLEMRHLKYLWHNGAFDMQPIRRRGIRARIDQDAMLLHYVLDERSSSAGESKDDQGGAAGHHDLKMLARRYCNAPDWTDELRRYIKNRNTPWSAIPAPVRNKYHAYDCDYTRRLYYVLLARLQREWEMEPSPNGYPPPITVYHNILIPATNRIADIEMHGVRIDRPYLDGLYTRVEGQIVTNEQALRLSVGEPDLNFNSPQQLGVVMYDKLGLHCHKRTPTGARSTDEESLGFHSGNAFVKGLLQHREYQKRFGTFIKGIKIRLSPDDLIHTSLLLHGTPTGRLSSRDPNLQNIMRDDEIKRMYIPRDGYLYFEADRKQLEVRVAAMYSRDPELILACKGDVHGEVAERVFAAQYAEARRADQPKHLDEMLYRYHILKELRNKIEIAVASNKPLFLDPFEEKPPMEQYRDAVFDLLRFMTKFITFGIIYGRQAYSLATGELNCPVEEAERYLDEFFKRFRKLKEWMDKQREIVKDYGFVDQPTGRRRRLMLRTEDNVYKIDNQAINTPIQGFASDINTTAFVNTWDSLTAWNLGYVLYPVHDSTVGEILIARADEALAVVKGTAAAVISDPEIDFPLDIKVGRSWGETTKWIPTARY